MAAKLFKQKKSGQSMMEFALLMPVVVAILGFLIQVQSAISTSIVNQKYARSQLFFLFFNHRYYPEKGFLNLDSGSLKKQYYVGVSDKVEQGSGSGSTTPTKVEPAAPTRKIGNFRPSTDEDSQVEGVDRQNVRIRTLVFTCVPPLALKFGEEFTEGRLGESTFLSGGYTYCDGDK